MRLLICGSRDWEDYPLLLECLRGIHATVVIQGGARGADRLGRRAAESLGIAVMEFPANWNFHGKRAGPIRNAAMLRIGQPDRVLAFHDDLTKSAGTKHMVGIALKEGVPVMLVTHKGVMNLTGEDLP